MGKYKAAIRALADIYKEHLRGNESYVIKQFPDNGMDTLIYSWLIMMYGDYGTSPRVGWLTNLPGAVKWLDEFMEDWKNGN